MAGLLFSKATSHIAHREIDIMYPDHSRGLSLIHDLDMALLRTFVAIVDTGGLTSAGKKVGRTQPAITHQIKRLENCVGRTLFGVNRRQLSLTRDGEVLLEFARAAGLRSTDQPGLFPAQSLGLLPYPDVVEIELRCTRSVHLHAAVESNEIDIALMTNQPGFRRGQLVRREPLVWVAGVGSSPELRKPLPLAVLPQGSVYRHLALEALGAAGQQWCIRSVCDSIAGLQAAVFAGLAVSVFPRCAIVSNVRCLDESEGMPKLPTVELVMHRKSQGISNAAEQLAQYIARELGDSVSAPIARESDSR